MNLKKKIHKCLTPDLLKGKWKKSKGIEKSTEEVSEPQETKVENKKSKKNAKNN